MLGGGMSSLRSDGLVGADGIEDVPPEARLGQEERTTPCALVFDQTLKALGLARDEHREEVRAFAAEVAEELQHVFMSEVVREDDSGRRSVGRDLVDVIERVRALRRDAGSDKVGLQAIEGLPVRRKDRDARSNARVSSGGRNCHARDTSNQRAARRIEGKLASRLSVRRANS
jgi:hypothetical protein